MTRTMASVLMTLETNDINRVNRVRWHMNCEDGLSLIKGHAAALPLQEIFNVLMYMWASKCLKNMHGFLINRIYGRFLHTVYVILTFYL